jgi:hypothetical protein
MRNVEIVSLGGSNFWPPEYEEGLETTTPWRSVSYTLFPVFSKWHKHSRRNASSLACTLSGLCSRILVVWMLTFKQLLYLNWKWDTSRPSFSNATIVLVYCIYDMSAISFRCRCQRKRRRRIKRNKIEEEQVSSLFHGDSFIFGLIAQAACFYVL